jgi:hypothetical protein
MASDNIHRAGIAKRATRDEHGLLFWHERIGTPWLIMLPGSQFGTATFTR